MLRSLNSSPRRWWRPGWPFGFVLLLALALRVYGLGFGLPAVDDSDELMFQLGAMKMLGGGTLNPGWFGHPAITTMYALSITDIAVYLVSHWLGWFASPQAFIAAVYLNPTWAILPGRCVMVLFSLGTVWQAGRFAERLWGRDAGLTAALLLAVSPVFVLWSQVVRSDIVGCFFMVLTLSAAHRLAHRGNWRDYLLAALWTACAVASKWPFAISMLAVAGAVMFNAGIRHNSLAATCRALACYAGLTCVFLVLISPYLVLDFSTVVRDVAAEGQLRHLGATGGGALWNAQWYLGGPLLKAFGVAGAALSIAGLVLLGKDRLALAILAPPLVGFFILLIFQNMVWERWALPIIVLLSLICARPLAWLSETVHERGSRRYAGTVAAALLVLMAVQPSIATVEQSRARNNDTRQRAAAWAISHFRAGSTVMVEHFAFDLLPYPWTFYFPMGDLGCIDANEWLRGKVAYARIEAARAGRSNVDYGTVAPAAAATCNTDYAILTQYDRYAAERDRFPAEFRAYQRLLERGRIVATIAPVPGVSSGPVVRIVAFKE
jgi:4-amino-4-deoxy-L-arabinose transferase-like glycosyltransferase